MCHGCCDGGDYEFDSDSDLTDPDLTDLDTDSLEDSSSQCSEHSSLNEAFSEDNAGEYDEETHEEQPAKKRARADKGTDPGTAPVAKESSRRNKTPSAIVTMPIDILLEIFGLLEPVDLLSLLRTNKAFREVVLSNNSVWKAARVNSGVPDCMPGMSEAKWATLLFGGYQCHECGAKGFHRMYLGIKRRLCHSCVNENLITRYSLYFPDCDPDIVDLVPFTYFGGRRYDSDDLRLFWSKDVHKMAKQLEVYQNDVHVFKPGAGRALEDFKQSRKKSVDSIVNHAAICNDWAEKDRGRQDSRVHELRNKNNELVEARLVVLGHSVEDVERMFGRHHYGVLDKELTDTRWKHLLPKIERKLSELKEEWRLEEQRNFSSRRRGLILDMYQKYVRPLPRAIIPPQEDFLKLCDIAEFINSPPTGDGESDVRPFADRIPGLCAEYMHSRKLALTQLLAHSTNVLQDTTTLQSQGVDAPDDMLMQLATSVFQCTQSPLFPLITWDKVQYHTCSHSECVARGCTFSISQPGVAAVRSLLGLVGLDAQTTTATAMDQLQCRFFCSNCTPTPQGGGSYRMAMNWRRSVFHYVEQQDRDSAHAEPRWELLSAAQLQVIQSLPTPPYPGAYVRAWRCNKCELYHGYPHKKAIVIRHMKSMHGITAPAEGIDFSYDQGVYEKPPPATKFFVIPQTEQPSISESGTTKKSKSSKKSRYRCQRCNDLQRTFILEGVKMHIKAKHSIDSPKEGTDFCKTN